MTDDPDVDSGGQAEPAQSRRARTRAQRRKAERLAGRDQRVRRLRLIIAVGAVVAVLAGGASLIVLLTGGGSAKAVHSPASTTSASGTPGAQFANPGQAAAFLAAASSDIVAVTTYDYRRLGDALSAGLAVATGTFRAAYQQALTGQLAATAQAGQIVHTFDVLAVGIGSMNAAATQAKVLVFGRQLVSAAGSVPTPSLVTLCATMQREGSAYLISELVQDGSAGVPPGTADLAAAAEAGRTEVLNLLSYSRSSFDSDLQRALSGSTEPLQGQIQQNATSTQTGMTQGHYDLSGLVTAIAVQSAAGDTVVLLVGADSSRLSDLTTGSTVTQVRYLVTVVKVGSAWLTSQVTTLTPQ